MRELGIPIYFFTGNHDMWMFDYFEKELGIPVYRKPIEKQFGKHTFYIGHGDGLGPGDYGYKFIKKVFSNKLCQWLFARLHPNFALALMRFFSKSSRNYTSVDETIFTTKTEWLVQFVEKEISGYDYYVFGHRHLPIDYNIKSYKGKYINLGDWLYYCSYAVYDGNEISLMFYNGPSDKIYGNEN
jgi:UDP-2,3-diacylglucosamine hydrolase